MKKLMIAAALLATVMTSNAQDSYKFVAGDNNLEVNFTPFSGSPIRLDNIKYRRFISESVAVRVGVGLAFSSNTSVNDINDPNPPINNPPAVIELNRVNSSFSFSINPGIEKHFAGTERLSPYIGATLGIGMRSTTDKEERYVNSSKKVETNTVTGANGNFNFNVNAIAGFDYYFAKRLYVGVELGLGLNTTSNSEIKIEDTQSGFVTPNPVRGGSSFGFSPNVNSAIRLGFLF